MGLQTCELFVPAYHYSIRKLIKTQNNQMALCKFSHETII